MGLEVIDDTGFGGYKVVRGSGFNYGVDTVLLSAFVSGETGGKGIFRRGSQNRLQGIKIADLGTGNAILPVLLSHKLRSIKPCFTGFEINSNAVARARKSVEINGLADSINIVESDVAKIKETGGFDALFDAVITNPPYFKKGTAIPSSNDEKRLARHETTATLDDFICAASLLLVDGGDFFMVHRPERIDEIFESMKRYEISPFELQMIVPRDEKMPNIMLVHGVKGENCMMVTLTREAVYKNANEYTEFIERIYERK